jgi:methylmalonyl-CoA mutase N-terminal domain/subunit
MEAEANKIFERIKNLGGVIPAIEKGYFQKELAEAAFRYQREIDKNERIIVGVNDYTEGNEEKPHKDDILKIDFAKAQKTQTARLDKLKATRGPEHKKRLAELREAAQGTDNLMPHLINAVKAYATLQEICDVFRDVWGTYREKPMF